MHGLAFHKISLVVLHNNIIYHCTIINHQPLQWLSHVHLLEVSVVSIAALVHPFQLVIREQHPEFLTAKYYVYSHSITNIEQYLQPLVKLHTHLVNHYMW